jgi:hypothetical protein
LAGRLPTEKETAMSSTSAKILLENKIFGCHHNITAKKPEKA